MANEPQAPQGIDVAKAVEWYKLDTLRKSLEEQAKEAKESAEKLQAELLEQFAEAGVDSIKVKIDGKQRTIWMQRQVWASAKDGDYDRATKALSRHGMKDYVQKRFNTNSISAFVREQEDLLGSLEKLPQWMHNVFSFTEKFSIRSRK